MDDLRFATLLCTRLCHDLVGPVGAINNGLELLEEIGGEMPDDIVAMTRDSARATARRLEFFRAAFGLPSSAVDSFDGVRGLAEGMFAGEKVSLDWPAEAPAEEALGDGHGRVLLALILCGTEMLPRGGCIAIRFPPQVATSLDLDISGQVVTGADARARAFEGVMTAAEVSPRGVAPYVATRLAAAAGGRLTLAVLGPGRARVSLVLGNAPAS